MGGPASLAVAFASVVVVHILGAMSPGPAFVYSARVSVAVSRQAGVFVALGMGFAALFWVSLVMLGLAVVVREAEWLYLGLKLAGGLYLFYLGIMLWRAAPQPLREEKDDASLQAYPRGLGASWNGFVMAVSNPKMIVFTGSVISAVLPPDPPLWFKVATLAAVFTNEFLWYAVVALVFSTGAARRTYGRFKVWIDRLAGGVIAALGLRIMLSER
ncbi:MAG: LysE family transporter [Alphaproteobacteria bacterium]|mgnify:CR=1 FL=1